MTSERTNPTPIARLLRTLKKSGTKPYTTIDLTSGDLDRFYTHVGKPMTLSLVTASEETSWRLPDVPVGAPFHQCEAWWREDALREVVEHAPPASAVVLRQGRTLTTAFVQNERNSRWDVYKLS